MPAKTPTRENMPLYFFIALLTFFSACGLLGGGDDKEPLEPGPRNYEWTVDTLHSPPGGFVYDIWGSSPEDVWAVAGGGLNNLWYFDGNEWSVWPERIGPSFYSIYGFALDDVWMGGNDGQLYHFDGEEWSLSYKFDPEGFENAEITDVWGTSSSDIYAIGNVFPEGESFLVSFIIHYDGNSWEELIITDFEVQLQQFRVKNGTPFIRAVKLGQPNPDTLLFYQYKQGKLRELLSKLDNEVNSMSLNNIGSQVYYFVDNKISSYKNNDFKEVLSFPNMPLIINLDGRHRKDLFLHTRDKTFHYNGENKALLLEDLPRNVFRSQLFKKEIFFAIRDYNNGTNLVYHGTLTEQEE